jgi:hypothetical protein
MDEQLTITGMAVAFGDVRTLEAFGQAVYAGEPIGGASPSFEQIVGVADEALFDAAVSPGAAVDVYVVAESSQAMALSEAITARWRLMGPTRPLSARGLAPLAVLNRLHAATIWSEVDAVLLVAVGPQGAAALILTSAPTASGYAQ